MCSMRRNKRVRAEGTRSRLRSLPHLPPAQRPEVIVSKEGKAVRVDKVKVEDLVAGKLETSWGLTAVHQAVSADQASSMLKAVSIGVLLSSFKGAWDSSDELNQMFPDYGFTPAEDFLAKVWQDKP